MSKMDTILNKLKDVLSEDDVKSFEGEVKSLIEEKAKAERLKKILAEEQSQKEKLQKLISEDHTDIVAKATGLLDIDDTSRLRRGIVESQGIFGDADKYL